MRVLIIGGSGLIGSALTARLIKEGHACATVSRGIAPANGVDHHTLDISGARPEHWTPILASIDAVVNAAGAFQGEALHGVHVSGAASLYEACQRAGVRRIIHLSAIGVDRETPTTFSNTKRQGEEALMARDLNWVILRPSVVVGRAAYGGSALMRGLAAMPALPVLPDTAPIQPVHLDDVIDTILFFLGPKAPARIALDLAGPSPMKFSDAVGTFRTWLRWRPAPSIRVPRPVAALLYRVGDLVRLLGWATPLSSTARIEMARGATGNPARWTDVTGIAPRPLASGLTAEPASVQERWFARLYVLKPLIFGVFGAFWIATGFVSLGPGWEQGLALMREGGASEATAAATVVAGALADIAIGLAILWRPTSRYGLWAAVLITLTYVVIGTLLVPRLWSDPLGPMLKIWPVLMLNLVAFAVREDR